MLIIRRLAEHPAATAPVVQDGGRMLCESAAIVEYLCHKYADGGLAVSPDQSNHYVERISRRPAYVKAMAIAGPAATPPSAT